jgi:hypothetical protein
MYNNISGIHNTALGAKSLDNSQTGFNNVAVGYNSLSLNFSGSGNIGVGHSAGTTNSSGDYNICIGYLANLSSGNLNNAIAIGHRAAVGASNAMALGGTGDDQVRVGIGTTVPGTDLEIKQRDVTGNGRGFKLEREDTADDWRLFAGGASALGLAFNNMTMGSFDSGTGMYTPMSDIRLKKDIQPVKDILSKVLQLEPKSYTFIADANQKKTLGFISQEVEMLFPEAVFESEEGFKALAYDEFAVIAIQAIKEQQAIIAQQQVMIDNLLQRVQVLEQE